MRRGGGIGDVRLAVEGMAPAVVQLVGLAHLESTVGPVRTKVSSLTLRPISQPGPTMGLCVARKRSWPDLLLSRAFLQAAIWSGRHRSCSEATVAGHASGNRSGRWTRSGAVLRGAVGLLLVLLSTTLPGHLLLPHLVHLPRHDRPQLPSQPLFAASIRSNSPVLWWKTLAGASCISVCVLRWFARKIGQRHGQTGACQARAFLNTELAKDEKATLFVKEIMHSCASNLVRPETDLLHASRCHIRRWTTALRQS